MKKRSESEIIKLVIYLIPTAMLLIAPFYHGDNSYYLLLKVFVFFSSCLSVYSLKKNLNTASIYIWIIIAILFNPFIHINLSREFWSAIDILSGVFYINFLIKNKYL